MKLAPKITIIMVAIVGVVLSLCGFAMISSNFNRSYKEAIAHNTSVHLSTKDSIKRFFATSFYSGKEVVDLEIAAYALQMTEHLSSQNDSLAILSERKSTLYSNLPGEFSRNIKTTIFEAEQPSYQFYRFNGVTYIAMSSRVLTADRQLWLISVFDVTSLFVERRVQLYTF